MSTIELEEALVDLVLQISGIDTNIDRNADLYLDLRLASFHALQLLVELEERYGMKIPDEDFVEANTVVKLARLIETLMQSQKAGIQNAG